MTTGVANAEHATRAPQVGSFTIAERLPVPESQRGQILLRVIGSEGTPVAGRAGLATCYAAPKDETVRSSAQALLTKVSALRHPSLVPVLQAGMAGNVVFWVHTADAGQRIPAPTPEQPMPIATVVAIVNAVAAGLGAAHEIGLSHGSLSLESIVSMAPGAYAVGGLGVMGHGPARDQRDLGVIAVCLLSGRPWREDAAEGPVAIEERVARAQRLREWLSGSTERVVNVLLRATELNPTDRYPSITEFAAEFANSVMQSGEDLVYGAFEAISSRNVELARLLAAKAAHYNPASEGLALLNIQLGGGSPFGMMPGTTVPGFGSGGDPLTAPTRTLPPLTQEGARQKVLSLDLAPGLPPEFRGMIAPQFEVPVAKKRINPILVLVLGGLGMVFLLLVAAMGTMLLTGG